jgi:proline racemase
VTYYIAMETKPLHGRPDIPDPGGRTVECVDYHTAGEPFRIVARGLPEIPGRTVAERRALALGPDGAPLPGELDTLRRLVCHEPRGHADMYGGLVVPPDDAGAHLGVLFWHKDGYSTACGHGTIALGVWAVDSGLVDAPDDGDAEVRIDVPSGRVAAVVHRSGGRTTAVSFRNVPARVAARRVTVKLPGHGPVPLDLAHAGACYASLPAAAVGLEVTPADLPQLIRVGRLIKAALLGHPATLDDEHPLLSGVYGVVFHQESDEPDSPAPSAGETSAGETSDTEPEVLRQRNVTVFADGQVDRSPCGSGTSARLALLVDQGRLALGQKLWHESVVGTVFRAQALAHTEQGLVTEVTGSAHITGFHRFVTDPHDPLGTGFVLR